MATPLLLMLRSFIARCFFGSPPPPPPPALAPASALEDDDLLLEILVHLPSLPSSLLRASLVCKRWRRIISEPAFNRRFRAHHRTTPLLGFFTNGYGFGHSKFIPTLAPPDCIPSERFTLHGKFLRFLGCRHGLALFNNLRQLEAVVWDPIARRQIAVAYPPQFTAYENSNSTCHFHGTVLSTSVGDGHGPLSSFKLLLLRLERIDNDRTNVSMCLYESETGKWGSISYTEIPYWHMTVPYPHMMLPSVLVESTLCGFLHWPTGILEFDLDRLCVGIIQKPEGIHSGSEIYFRVVHTDDGGLGFAVMKTSSIKLYGRKASPDGIHKWVLQKTIELDRPSLSLTPRSQSDQFFPTILGFDEDNDVIHLATATGIFMVQLDSIQFTKLSHDCRMDPFYYYPYTNFYTLGR